MWLPVHPKICSPAALFTWLFVCGESCWQMESATRISQNSTDQGGLQVRTGTILIPKKAKKTNDRWKATMTPPQWSLNVSWHHSTYCRRLDSSRHVSCIITRYCVQALVETCLPLDEMDHELSQYPSMLSGQDPGPVQIVLLPVFRIRIRNHLGLWIRIQS